MDGSVEDLIIVQSLRSTTRHMLTHERRANEITVKVFVKETWTRSNRKNNMRPKTCCCIGCIRYY
jgi:hypothetical protein